MTCLDWRQLRGAGVVVWERLDAVAVEALEVHLGELGLVDLSDDGVVDGDAVAHALHIGHLDVEFVEVQAVADVDELGGVRTVREVEADHLVLAGAEETAVDALLSDDVRVQKGGALLVDAVQVDLLSGERTSCERVRLCAGGGLTKQLVHMRRHRLATLTIISGRRILRSWCRKPV